MARRWRSRDEIIDAQWADNGPGWIAVMLKDGDAVLNLTPDFSAADSYDIGVVGPYPLGVIGQGDPHVVVRAFFRAGGQPAEDPVTGSLNAALAQWLLGNGTLTSPYVASQGTVIGRDGRVYVDETDGEIWIGGDAVTVVTGTVNL